MEGDSSPSRGPYKPSRSRSSASSSSASARAKRPRYEHVSGLSVHSQDKFGDSTVQGNARVQFGHQYFFGAPNQQQPQSAVNDSEATPPEPNSVMKSLKFERMNARYLGLRPGLARTCEWLYQRPEYTTWRNWNATSMHHGCLWIKGKPGSGKTTLMKMAVDHDKKRIESNAVISHFFFRGGGEVSADMMYRSLIYQLLEQLPRLESVLDIWTAANLQPHDWPSDLLRNILRAAVLRLGNVVLTCYIDALDECDDSEAASIIEYFEDLTDSTVSENIQFFFCVSSRHYPHITMAKCQDLVLDYQEGHSQDIARFVKDRLKLNDTARKRQLAQAICDKASGVFLWVYLVVVQLNKESGGSNAGNLQDRLNMMPSELPRLFEQIVRQDARDDPEFIRTIQWTLFAKRPLKRRELYCAVQGCLGSTNTSTDHQEVETEDIDKFILRSSKGFVELVKGKHPTFQFIHETVREYFYSVGLATLSPALRDNVEGQSHNRLKQRCQDYILQKALAKFPIPNHLSQARSAEAEKLRDEILEAFPLLEYALSGILYHADSAHGHGVPQQDFLYTFPAATWKKLNDCIEKFQSRRYNELDQRWIFVEQDASRLLELDLEKDVYIFTRPRRKTSLLGVAVDHNHLRNVQLLLRYGEPAQSLGSINGRLTCLDLAVKKGAEEIVTTLLASGACTHEGTVDLALLKGNLEISKAVIMNRIQTSIFGLAYGDFLWAASSHQNLEAVRWLLEQGAEVDKTFGSTCNALQKACAKGYVQIVLVLLEHGADVNLQSEQHGNALQAASEEGHTSVVKILIDHGANVDARGRESHTALQAASRSGHYEALQTLLKAGAEVDASGGYYGTALQAAAQIQWSSPIKIFELLLGNGANVNLEGGFYGNALQAVCAVECLKHRRTDGRLNPGTEKNVACAVNTVRLLLDSGAHINARGGHYGSALQAACAKSCPNVVQVLLNKGADPIAKGGFYGNVKSAVEMNERTDVAGMVIDATVKRLEILERFRNAFAENNTAEPENSEASCGDESEFEQQKTEQQSACVSDRTQVERASMEARRLSSTDCSSAPSETSRMLATHIAVPASTSPHEIKKTRAECCIEGKQPPTVSLTTQFETRNDSPDNVSTPLVQPIARTDRPPQIMHNKVMERTMRSLFGLEFRHPSEKQASSN
ncbi:hypothetical protein Q7P37_009047 [Cladosporium fusiforme]